MLPLAIRSLKIVFIIVWNVAGELVSPKNMTVGSKSPSGVKNAAFDSSPGLIRMLLYPHLMSNFVKRAIFVPQQRNIPRERGTNDYFIGRVTFHPKAIPTIPIGGIPSKYQRHKKVFSEEESQRLPQHTIWDHAIELLPGAPTSLPGRLLPLTQNEIAEVQKFVAEHLKRGTIHKSWSPYAANFFFVKKKDGKL